MPFEINDIDFAIEMTAQDRIKGRLVSGQLFSGKVFACGKDYFTIVELKIDDGTGNLQDEETDITKMRYDAVMYFDKDE